MLKSNQPTSGSQVDGVDYHLYGNDIVNNIEDLHRRLQRGAYKASLSRKTYISKADGKKRPPVIAALEDKIVQRAGVEVLSAILGGGF
jgi:retron-type reverse transcriptase